MILEICGLCWIGFACSGTRLDRKMESAGVTAVLSRLKAECELPGEGRDALGTLARCLCPNVRHSSFQLRDFHHTNRNPPPLRLLHLDHCRHSL